MHAASNWHCHQESGYLASRWAMDRGHYKCCVHLHRKEKFIMDVNHEMCPVGTPRRHVQGLHFASTLDCRAHRCPCALQVYRPSDGRSCSSSCRQLMRSIRQSSSCRTNRSSSFSRRSRSGSSRTCWLICSKPRASSRSMTQGGHWKQVLCRRQLVCWALAHHKHVK